MLAQLGLRVSFAFERSLIYMNFFKEAADIQDRVNRLPIAIALTALLIGGITYSLHWSDDPYRDGAVTFIRTDAVTLQAAGEIRRINLKRVQHGACKPRCDTYVFAVVGTRAIVYVSVKSWEGAAGKPAFRIVSRS